MNDMKESLLNVNHSGYDYIDCYEHVIIDKNDNIGIIKIAEAFIQPNSKWVEGLLALRNRIVSVFNLKTSVAGANRNHSCSWKIGEQAGMFKVFGRAENEIILGEDDKHLDFRVSLLLEKEGQHKKVMVTTVVKYHNRLGRCYFFFVKPVHRILVPMSLKQKFKHL